MKYKCQVLFTHGCIILKKISPCPGEWFSVSQQIMHLSFRLISLYGDVNPAVHLLFLILLFFARCNLFPGVLQLPRYAANSATFLCVPRQCTRPGGRSHASETWVWIYESFRICLLHFGLILIYSYIFYYWHRIIKFLALIMK